MTPRDASWQTRRFLQDEYLTGCLSNWSLGPLSCTETYQAWWQNMPCSHFNFRAVGSWSVLMGAHMAAPPSESLCTPELRPCTLLGRPSMLGCSLGLRVLRLPLPIFFCPTADPT